MNPPRFSLRRLLGAMTCFCLTLACWAATGAMNPPEPNALAAGLVVGASFALLGGGMGLLVHHGAAGTLIGSLLGLPTGLLAFVAFATAGC